MLAGHLVQQSSPGPHRSPDLANCCRQLSVPHTKEPEQSESREQSPSPSPHSLLPSLG